MGVVEEVEVVVVEEEEEEGVEVVHMAPERRGQVLLHSLHRLPSCLHNRHSHPFHNHMVLGIVFLKRGSDREVNEISSETLRGNSFQVLILAFVSF